jgi:rhodanese-related sulfurtransferase
MEFKLVVLAAIAVIAVILIGLPQHAAKTSGANARQMVANGALLLDVRTPGEFGHGHIDGALNIPVRDLPSRLTELGDHKRPIVVYCRSGARSAKAKRLLDGAGFDRVVDVGPMKAY